MSQLASAPHSRSPVGGSLLISAVFVAAIAVMTGAGLGIVALDILFDPSQQTSKADQAWAQTAATSAGLLFTAGINTLLSVIFRDRIARFFAIALYIAAVGAGVWGVSTGLDLHCVRQKAIYPDRRAIMSAKISIAASGISSWVGLIGLLAMCSLTAPRKTPVPDESESPWLA